MATFNFLNAPLQRKIRCISYTIILICCLVSSLFFSAFSQLTLFVFYIYSEEFIKELHVFAPKMHSIFFAG